MFNSEDIDGDSPFSLEVDNVLYKPDDDENDNNGCNLEPKVRMPASRDRGDWCLTTNACRS